MTGDTTSSTSRLEQVAAVVTAPDGGKSCQDPGGNPELAAEEPGELGPALGGTFNGQSFFFKWQRKMLKHFHFSETSVEIFCCVKTEEPYRGRNKS